MISIFTSARDATYLGEAYESLLAQQEAPPWEWVLAVPAAVVVADEIARDERVRVLVLPREALAQQDESASKRLACEQCRGEVLLELDAHDVLAAQALRHIHAAFETESAGFVYSDFCEFHADGSSRVQDAALGWESYPVSFRGREYQAMRAFAPAAYALQNSLFAPLRLRAWRAEVYKASGGHAASTAHDGDHDLVCRTYLTGAKFVHVAECLCFRRVRPDEPPRAPAPNPHFFRIVEEWCRREALPMLDLGGGHNSPPGYLSVDIANGDVVCDVRRGLPYPDASVGCVRAYDFLEHMPRCVDSSCRHGDDGGLRCAVGVMNEIYRVLVPGGFLVSRTPSTDGRGAFQDPTHVSFWNQNSFWYYTRREHARYVPGIACRYQATRVWQGFPDEWLRKHNILYVYADLIALKGQRQPGPVHI